VRAQQEAAPESPALDPSDLANPFVELPAAKPVAPTDPELPQPFDANVVTAVLKTSPFNRAVNLSDALVLTGVAYVDGKPMATLLNKDTKKTYVVTETPNADGWTLTEATPTSDIKRMQVKVNVAGEVVTIRHNDEMQDEAMKKHKLSPGGGAPPPAPSGDDKGFHRDKRGPSKEDRERFERLSDEGRGKVMRFFGENRERMMTMSEDDRRAFIKNSFEKIEKEDQKKGK
jgi:hypothetical protein